VKGVERVGTKIARIVKSPILVQRADGRHVIASEFKTCQGQILQ
jgi:hypothetical protein